MAFALVSGQTGTLRTNLGTLQTGSFNLLNSSGEFCAVGYDRLPSNVTLTVGVTGSASGGTNPVITVNSGTQFSAGDKIYIMSGTSTFAESATVQSVAGNNLTLAGVPFFNHNIGEVIHRFTSNQTLCVAIFNPVGDYIINSLRVTINGTATDLQLVDGSTATGAVSAVNGQSLLYVLPILSAQTNTQTTGYTINYTVTNLSGAYQSVHFNAMTFTGAYIPSSVTNANIAKSAGGTMLDGSSGTFGNALVMSAGTPRRTDLGTIQTTYDAQQQPFVAVALSTNTAFPANYTRTITTGVNIDASNNVTGALVSALTCTGTAGASTITVSSAPNTAGFVSNGVYTISDGANTETIQLTGQSVGATTTLNLVSPLANSHTSASITYATGFLPAAAMATPIGTGNVAQAWGVSGSAVVRTAISSFLPANGTQLYIHANGVGETCTVSSGGGTNILTMTSNLTRSYQNGIISTSPVYFNVPSPYGGYTIQANSMAAPANAAVLSVASGTGTKTSLSVNALPVAIVSGASLLLRLASNPATTQTVVLSAAASAGATTLSITSVSFATNFPIGTTLVNTGAGFAPLGGQGGGLIGTTLYPSNASVNNLTAFTQPAGQSIMATSVPLIATTAGQSSATSSTLTGTSPYPLGSQQFQSSTTVNSYVQNFRTGTTAGGTVSGNFMMFGGYNYGGTSFITPEILINAGGSGTAFSGWGYIYTFVPATPAITRAGIASELEQLANPSQKGRVYNAVNSVLETANAVTTSGRNLAYAIAQTMVAVVGKTQTIIRSGNETETFSTNGGNTLNRVLSNANSFTQKTVGVFSRTKNLVFSVVETFVTIGVIAKQLSVVTELVSTVVETFASTSAKALEIVRNNSTTVQQVVRDNRMRTMSAFGKTILTQTQSLASYIYHITQTISARFAENTERGNFAETSKVSSQQDATRGLFTTPNTLSQTFQEDGVSSYKEGT